MKVDIGGKDTWKSALAIYRGLAEAEAVPFSTHAGAVSIEENIEDLLVAEDFDPRRFIAWASAYIKTLRFSSDHGWEPAPMSQRVADAVLQHAREHFPPLVRFCECPIFSRNGHLLDRTGYHRAARSYVNVPRGYDPEMELDEAVDLIDDVIYNFPFDSPGDRANALAFPLTVILREMIQGPTPMFRFEAPTAGTGKGKLCRLLAQIVSPGAGQHSLSKNDEEIRKYLTSKLIHAPALLIFDNVEYLEATAIKTALTEDIGEDRLLGTNDEVKVPIRNAWAVTVNNPTFSKEMLRRTVRVKLNAHLENAETRRGWRHPNLELYARENRGGL